MITLIYSLVKLGGFTLWELFWAISVILYFVVFFALKINRSKGIKRILSGFLGTEVVFDILWAILYSFNHWYLEYGVGITYGFFVWCFMLLTAGVIITVKNKQLKNKA